MKILRQFGNFFREVWDTQKLLAMERNTRPLVFYGEDIATYIQFEGYVEQLTKNHGREVTYVTSDSNDPLFQKCPPRLTAYYVNRTLATFVRQIDATVFVTTVPDLGQLHVPRPPATTCCLYTFHSLNSIHEVYRTGAFDNYDAFFCTGPHHRRELAKHFEMLDRPCPELFDVGYYKLDRIHAAHGSYRKRNPHRKTILIAPSWGKNNLLESHGIEIVERLLALDVDVIVRPHPCFYLPIYPKGQQIIDGIQRKFGDRPNLLVERDINSDDAFHEADLMISDYSGAAYEYALGTARPVLFLDMPRKRFNERWHELGLPTFETEMREKVGQIVMPFEVSQIDRHVAAILNCATQCREQLQELRSRCVFNFGNSAEFGAAIIDDILHEDGLVRSNNRRDSKATETAAAA